MKRPLASITLLISALSLLSGTAYAADPNLGRYDVAVVW